VVYLREILRTSSDDHKLKVILYKPPFHPSLSHLVPPTPADHRVGASKGTRDLFPKDRDTLLTTPRRFNPPRLAMSVPRSFLRSPRILQTRQVHITHIRPRPSSTKAGSSSTSNLGSTRSSTSSAGLHGHGQGHGHHAAGSGNGGSKKPSPHLVWYREIVPGELRKTFCTFTAPLHLMPGCADDGKRAKSLRPPAPWLREQSRFGQLCPIGALPLYYL
jgi:hypothetical protein